jgi:hypothetical protein
MIFLSKFSIQYQGATPAKIFPPQSIVFLAEMTVPDVIPFFTAILPFSDAISP